jgi:hypothetical protein
MITTLSPSEWSVREYNSRKKSGNIRTPLSPPPMGLLSVATAVGYGSW